MSKGSDRQNAGLTKVVGKSNEKAVQLWGPTANFLVDSSKQRIVSQGSAEMELQLIHRYSFAATLATGLDVLDLGCGEGDGSYILAQKARSVVAVDRARSTVQRAAKRHAAPNLFFREGSGTALPIADQSVDLIVAFDALEQEAPSEAFLRDLKRVLKPNGLVVISSREQETSSGTAQVENCDNVRKVGGESLHSIVSTYFKHVFVGAQRTVFGSFIGGDDFNEAGRVFTRIGTAVGESRELANSSCLIAVASDSDLPDVAASIFDSGIDPYILSALQAGLVQRDLEIVSLRKEIDKIDVCLAEYREYQRLASLGQIISSQVEFTTSKWQEVFYHLAHRGFFKSGQPAAKILGCVERVYQRVFKRPSGLFEHHNFDEQFFLGWNPTAARYHGGAFRDYLTNWYPSPRESFLPGELVQLLTSLKTLASRCPSLRCAGDVTPKISIVIPVYNQLRVTLKCISSVLTAGALQSFEIIVVDDCSAPSVSDVLSKTAGIRHLRQIVNGGFIASCNGGASIARGEYLVFLNNDTHVLAGWLDELVKTFETRPKAGLVGSQLIYPNGVLQEAGAIMWRDGSGWNYGRGQKRDLPQFNYLRSVDWCSGASIMIPRALFNELGQFDPLYSPAYAEDVDLAFKVREAEYEVLYQPCSKVVHFEGVSSGTDTSTGIKAYQVVNLTKLYERWQPKLVTHGVPGVRPDLERDRGITKRILFMDAVTPTPDCDAGSMVVYQFMKIFLKLGYGVSFLPVDNLLPNGKYTEDLQRIGVECWHYPFVSSVDEYLRKNGDKFDLVFMYRAPEAARHLDAVRMYAPQAKIVFNTVDLHFVRAERQAEVEGSVLRRVQAAALKDKELQVMKSTEATILLNKSEVDLIKELAPSVKTFMLPLTQEVPGSRKAFAERKDMVFIGGFRHLPNVDAVKYFCSEVMPLVRMQLPGVKFVVVGSHVPDELHQYASEDVEIRGFVADLADVFDHCRISVAPLRFGAGMKGKIVTSLTYGVPCVTTKIGGEGMGLTEGENVLLAEDPASYAQAIVDVYTAESTWGKLSKAGIDFAKQNFSPEVVEQQIRQMMGELGV